MEKTDQIQYRIPVVIRNWTLSGWYQCKDKDEYDQILTEWKSSGYSDDLGRNETSHLRMSFRPQDLDLHNPLGEYVIGQKYICNINVNPDYCYELDFDYRPSDFSCDWWLFIITHSVVSLNK